MDRFALLARLLAGQPLALPMTDPMEWIRLVSLAQNQGVSPLLHQAVRRLAGVQVPAEADELLASDYREAVWNSLRQEAVWLTLCQSLSERGIAALLLKGAALARTCYEDPATRPMGDLDLLIPLSQIEAAARCLEQSGFRPGSGCMDTERRSPRSHVVAVHHATGVTVELHWELTLLGRAHRKATEEIWTGARPAAAEASALVMRPGHILPLLCAHMLLQHREPRLIWLYDVHRVLLTLEPSEAALARHAADRWRLGPCMALALLRVHELFATPLPRELTGWVDKMAARRDLQARVAAHALKPSAAEAPSEYLVSLLMNRNYPASRILFPTPSDIRQRLNLASTDPVGPRAYAAFLAKRLCVAPLHLRQLWSFWRSSFQSPRAESSSALPEAPLSEE